MYSLVKIYACMPMCMHARAHTRTHTQAHTHMHTHRLTHAYTCTTRTHVHTHMHLFLWEEGEEISLDPNIYFHEMKFSSQLLSDLQVYVISGKIIVLNQLFTPFCQQKCVHETGESNERTG